MINLLDVIYLDAYYISIVSSRVHTGPAAAPKPEFSCSFKADREQSFSPLCANFLISTKRHLNHLSVSYRSSRARRQAGQQNKQPTLLYLTYLGINGQKQQGRQ